jgi:flavodoxin
MNTLVIYDSLYGNTRIIAQAITDAIPGDVKMVHVNEVNASQLSIYDLLIVGAPTHGGRASEAVSSLLGRIEAAALIGVKVTAFDTRLTWWWLRLFGFAAPKIAMTLKKKGGTLIGTPEGFFVTGGEGPLQDGEVERAAAWAREITALVESATTFSRVAV